MDRATQARRRVIKPTEQLEARPVSEIDRKVYQLIRSGFLPSAGTVTKDGKPAWSFESIASIVGCRETVLVELMNLGGRLPTADGFPALTCSLIVPIRK